MSCLPWVVGFVLNVHSWLRFVAVCCNVYVLVWCLGYLSLINSGTLGALTLMRCATNAAFGVMVLDAVIFGGLRGGLDVYVFGVFLCMCIWLLGFNWLACGVLVECFGGYCR